MPDIGTISEFKSLRGYWVLFWFGRVVTHPDTSEHSIELFFVQLSNGLKDYDKFLKLTEDKNNTRYITVNISYSPILVLGTVIKDGKLYRRPSEFNETIVVELKKTVRLKGIPLKDITKGEQIHDFPNIHRYYNYFVPVTRAEALIPNGIDLVLFLSFEIARKYFLKSDALSKKIFAGEIGDKEIYYDKHPDGSLLPENTPESTYILITKDMYDSDAKHIARIKYNDQARKAALQVFSSIYGEVESKKKTVDTFFPFESPSKLEVVGRRLQIGVKKVFFVFQIKKCSAAFIPGERLEFNRINDGRTADRNNANKHKVTRTISNNKSKDWSEVELTSADKPNYQSLKELFSFNIEDEFDADPEVTKEEKEKQKTYNPESPVFDNNNVGSFSTNSITSGDRKTSKAGIETNNTEDFFDLFREALRILKENGYTFHYLRPANQQPPNSYYYTFPSDNLNEESRKWCFLRKKDTNAREIYRKCIVVELISESLHYYVLEIQPKYSSESFYTFLISHDFGVKIQESEILTILNEIASHQGKIRGKFFKSINTISCTRIEHTTVTVESRKYKNPQYLLNALKRLL